MYLDKNLSYPDSLDYSGFQQSSYLMDERNCGKDSCAAAGFVDPLTGIIRGNLFKDEFLTYKKYIPIMPTLKTERARKLFELQKYDFAIHELKLYLDLCPSHPEALALFKKYTSEHDNLIKDYIDKYGPVKPTQNIYFSKWIWVNEPWPWEGDK